MFPGGKLPGEDFINSWYPIVLALGIGLIFGIRNYMRGPKNSSGEGAEGKVTIITGATKGIGREIAREMAIRGSRVIIAGRDEAEAKFTLEEVERASKNDNLEFIKLDLASFASVRSFAKTILEKEERIDYLFNNAGVMSQPYTLTEDGNEIHLQVNYLSHFLLTNLLLPKLKESTGARIINLLAPAYSLIEPPWFEDPNFIHNPDSYTTTQSYSGAKTSVYMFTRYLAKKLEGTNVTVNCVLPGIVNTDLYNLMPFRSNRFLRFSVSPIMWFLTKTAFDGAQTPCYVALAKEEEAVSGKIYKDLQIVEPVDTIPPPELDVAWWNSTLELIAGTFKPREPEAVADDNSPEAEVKEAGSPNEAGDSAAVQD